MKPYGLRDRIAAAACNWILRHVASERYRKMTGGALGYGLASAARDEREDRPVPQPPGLDPVLAWLASEDSRQHEGHWVAVDGATGEYRGNAGSKEDHLRWSDQGAVVLFVEPAAEEW